MRGVKIRLNCWFQGDIVYSSHNNFGTLKTASSTSVLEQANHAAAFHHLQHIRSNNNEDMEGLDVEYAMHTPQHSFKRRYQG